MMMCYFFSRVFEVEICESSKNELFIIAIINNSIDVHIFLKYISIIHGIINLGVNTS